MSRPGILTAALLVAATLVFGGFPAALIFQTTTPQAPLAWSVIALCLLAGVLAVSVLVVCRAPVLAAGGWIAGRFASGPVRSQLTLALLVGLLLRLLSAWIVDPVPASDGATYLSLATKLLQGLPYEASGTYAYWPPGMAFALLPFVATFGPGQAALVMFGLFWFLVGAAGLVALGRSVGLGQRSALPVWLLALWPTHVLCTGLPEKELIIMALLPWVLHLGLRALGGSKRAALGAGGLLGALILVQPSLQLLPVAGLLAALIWCRPWTRIAAMFVIGTLAMLAFVAPWTYRNYLVLGAPVLVSTNGGSNLYRANNELATGGYVQKGRVDVGALGELNSDLEGRRLAVEWGVGNPLAFAQLGLTKALIFAGDGSFGAYAAFRGDRNRISTPAYLALKAGAALPWLVFWALIVVKLPPAPPFDHDGGRFVALLLPYAYLSTLHTVFESGSKYHLPAVPPLLILLVLLFTSASRLTPIEWKSA